jgi:SAM-dependent methyltransferase
VKPAPASFLARFLRSEPPEPSPDPSDLPDRASAEKHLKGVKLKLDDRAARIQALEKEKKQLLKQNAELEREVEQLESVVRGATRTRFSELPPESLRLNVGTRTTAANFWSQGFNSSSRMVEIFGLEPTGAILDWGCGSGRTVNWLWPQGTWKEVWHGCDVDAAAIQWLRTQGVSNASVCDPQPPLPYPDSTFDGIYSFSVLTHIHPTRHRDWYAELHRILKPGGKAYLTTQGQVVIDTKRISDAESVGQYRELGWCHCAREGHYKDAALVSPEFTKKTASEFFAIQDYQIGGYQKLMDAFLLRKK